MKACISVFIFHFFLHLHLLLCSPTPKFEIKTFSYKSWHFSTAHLFLELLHFLVGRVLLLPPVSPLKLPSSSSFGAKGGQDQEAG